MAGSANNSTAPWAVRQVIEKAVADWLKGQPQALVMPITDPVMGSLAILITRRLVEAGLIDPEALKAL